MKQFMFSVVTVSEDDLIEQLKTLIDDIDIQTVPMKERAVEEVKRIKAFEQMLLDTKSIIIIKDIDIRNYAKFILQEGKIEEKRELLRCLKGEIILKSKKIHLKG